MVVGEIWRRMGKGGENRKENDFLCCLVRREEFGSTFSHLFWFFPCSSNHLFFSHLFCSYLFIYNEMSIHSQFLIKI